MPYADPQDPRRKESQRRYNSSAKAKAAWQRFYGKHKERVLAEKKTEKAREQQRRYREKIKLDSERVDRDRKAKSRYQKSEKGKQKLQERIARQRQEQGIELRAPLSEEERKRRRKESLLRYAKTQKCKDTARRFQRSEKGKALRARQNRSEHHRRSLKKYRSTNKYKLWCAVYGNKRRNLGKSVESITQVQWIRLCEVCEGRCAYCRRGACETMDHVLSLYLGGDSRAINIMPACRSCNSRKHRSALEEALQRLNVNERNFHKLWEEAREAVSHG